MVLDLAACLAPTELVTVEGRLLHYGRQYNRYLLPLSAAAGQIPIESSQRQRQAQTWEQWAPC